MIIGSVVLLFGNLGFAGVLHKAENIEAIHRHFMMGHAKVSGTHLTCNQSLLRVNDTAPYIHVSKSQGLDSHIPHFELAWSFHIGEPSIPQDYNTLHTTSHVHHHGV